MRTELALRLATPADAAGIALPTIAILGAGSMGGAILPLGKYPHPKSVN